MALAGEPVAPTLGPVNPDDPGWRQLAAEFVHHGDVTANFGEERWYPFRKQPIELTGEVRVSADHGLSLHYRTPEQRVVIVDRDGLLIRDGSGQTTAPSDPRAMAMNDVLLRILRLDLGALQQRFELRGERRGDDWTLELAPRAEDMRRIFQRITVSGSGPVVWRIELRHSPKQFVAIQMARPYPPAPFTPDELRRYFR